MTALLATLPLQLVCQMMTTSDINFGNVTIVQDTSATNHQPSILPEGYTAFPDIGVAYKYYKNKLTWNAARKQCLADGATLAIVDSFKKIEIIMGIKIKDQGLHTGIHRLFDSIEWTSIKTGKPLGFIPWKPDANVNSGTGSCVAMWFDGSGVGPWNCSNVLPAVCEVPLFKEKTERSGSDVSNISISALPVH